jgi:hypothetical protein
MPTLILSLVTQSAITVARDAVWRGMDAGIWDEGALRAFSAEFLTRNVLADFQWTVETERAWAREIEASLMHDPAATSQMLNFGASRSALNEWLLWLSVSRPAWHRNNQLWSERAHDERAALLDVEAGVWRPADLKHDWKKLSEREREVDLAMAAASAPMFDGFMRKAVWSEAQNRMAAISCGLELARRASGKYPDSLEALVPKCLPRVPFDPATGKAFRYGPRPDGTYFLYSVGLDQKDQGGEVNDDADRNQDDPDWPWFAPRSAPDRRGALKSQGKPSLHSPPELLPKSFVIKELP